MASTLTPAEIASLKGQSEIPSINITNGICLGVAFLAIVLRLFARRLTKLAFARDDGFIIVAWVLFAAYVASSAVATHYGMGRHIIFVTSAYGLATSLIAVFCFYNVTIPFIKFSILCLYIRIFPQDWLRTACLGIGAFVFSYSFAQLMLDIFQCVPIKSQWDPTVKGHCVNEAAVIIAGGVLNIVTDFVILALPMPLLWRLQIPVHKKRLLSAIFLVGLLACVASIVRLAYASAVNTTDSTYNDLGGLITSTVEITLGIIAACIPTYKALVNMIFQKRVISTLGSHRFRSNRSDGIELVNGEASSERSLKGRRWDKITQETTITQYHQNSVDNTKERFGVSNVIGNAEPIQVPRFEQQL